ncbi:MAG: hypothetical protein WC369_08375 [Dehalococcoidales bacterium]|jgi:hypothetical protein
MWRSKKFIITAVLAAVILVGSTVGVVLAQDENGDTSQPQTIFERATAILGTSGVSVTADQLEAAFEQARNEMRDEATGNRFASLVEAGKITREQADQFQAWLEERPDMEQFRQELKNWQQSRPDTPSELTEWREARPDMPQLGRFSNRGFQGVAKWGLGGQFPGR